MYESRLVHMFTCPKYSKHLHIWTKHAWMDDLKDKLTSAF